MHTKHRTVKDIEPDTRAWHEVGPESTRYSLRLVLLHQASQAPRSKWHKASVFQPVSARGGVTGIMEKSLFLFSEMSTKCLQIKANEREALTKT